MGNAIKSCLSLFESEAKRTQRLKENTDTLQEKINVKEASITKLDLQIQCMRNDLKSIKADHNQTLPQYGPVADKVVTIAKSIKALQTQRSKEITGMNVLRQGLADLDSVQTQKLANSDFEDVANAYKATGLDNPNNPVFAPSSKARHAADVIKKANYNVKHKIAESEDGLEVAKDIMLDIDEDEDGEGNGIINYIQDLDMEMEGERLAEKLNSQKILSDASTEAAISHPEEQQQRTTRQSDIELEQFAMR